MTALFLLVQVSAVEAADKKLENLNEFSVSDSRTVWRKKTDIALFHFSYENAEGVVTAESGNGEKILAPGTEGSYTFSIRNKGKYEADCRIWIETERNERFPNPPFQVRLSRAKGWVLGSRTVWKRIEDLDTCSVTERVPAGDSLDYTLYWRWPFEPDTGEKEIDTQMGNLAEARNLDYKVTIHMQAVQSEKGTGIAAAVGTGDRTNTGGYCLLLAATAMTAGTILYRRRKEK